MTFTNHNPNRSFGFKSLYLSLTFALVSCGGGGGSSTPPPPAPPPLPAPPPPPSSVFAEKPQTSRFLSKATFGATQSEVDTLTQTEASDWIKAEFAKPETLYLPTILAELAALNDGERLPRRRISDHFFDAAIAGEDQLRQRMVFALSEIFVVSNGGQLGNFPATMAHYMDALSTNAFGNYRDLMTDITYSPAMGIYLTYLANSKGDPDTGRVPDENYARELLQLFTLGLTELNVNGTEKLDFNGQPTEIFDNTDITGLAKVFTGLSYENNRFGRFGQDRSATYKPLIIFPEFHSDLEKSFLGTTIPANTSGDESITMALDAIFAHPNLAPFVSRQVIQRLTASNPSSAYVERVATSFETGTYTLPDGSSIGTGQRGDMRAMISAILFDAEALLDPSTAPSNSGKIREPILRFIGWARAFNETTPDAKDERNLNDTSAIGQHPFRSPSVFNFFRPGFVAPGTETGAAGLTAPELQIMNESSAIAYINFINNFIYDTARNISGDADGGINPDYTNALALADDAQALVDHIDLLLTGNSLSPNTRTRILDMMNDIPIEAGSEDEDRQSRVRLAITMTMTAPGYIVQK